MPATSFILLLVIQLILVLGLSRIMGHIFVRFRQPQVMGEMIAGIMLGPSLFGWLAPGLFRQVFSPDSIQYLDALSQVGVIFFLFLIGLELDPKLLRDRGKAAIAISLSSIAAPMLLGIALAVFLYAPLFTARNAPSLASVALFMGAAMSITAFPVLARILAERNMLGSRLGTVAIACAAVDDVTGWCILAYIVVFIRASHSATSIWITLGGITIFGLVMIYAVRRLLQGFATVYHRTGELSENMMALMLLLVLVASLCTERLGIHLLFGAFMMGAIMPKEQRFVRYVLDRFETITVTLLLPLFFAFTGLRTDLSLVKGPQMWMYCGLIIVVATVGKLGGSTVAAWLSGMPPREAAGLGTLMNTRGLMELVILDVGLDIGVISPALFSMMIVMALVTTFMTTPMLHLVCPKELLQGARDKAMTQQVAVQPPGLPEGESAAA